MGQFTSTSDLNGFTFEVYDKIVRPIPDSAKLIKRVPFKGGALELGNKLHVNVVTSDEGGFTYAPPNGGAVTAQNAISFETQDAQVDAYQMGLETSITYEMAARASSSKKAFVEVVGEKLLNSVLAGKRRLEISALHGQQGLGVALSSANADATHTVITLTLASHAPHIWIGKKNSKLRVYNVAAIVGTNAFTITAVNVLDSVRTVTVSGDAADIAALDVAIAANPSVCKLYWDTSVTGTAGTFAHQDMLGAMGIAQNATTMFNINAALYDVWAGNSLAIGGKLNMDLILKGVAQLANRGLEGDVVGFLHPTTWQNVANDQAALRRYGAEIQDAKNGAQSVVFSHMTGKIELVGHGYIKGGEALIAETSKWKRVGARDFAIGRPGRPEDEFWFESPTAYGYSCRYYGLQAIFCEMPSHQIVLTGIVNS